MKPEELHDLRKSFAHVTATGHVAALIFYRRLFEIAPALRPLFRGDIEEQANKLTAMLAGALEVAGRAGQFRAMLEQLGTRHVAYGARPEHYPVVAEALLDMLAAVLGGEFTPDLRARWTKLLQEIASIMLDGAARAAAA